MKFAKDSRDSFSQLHEWKMAIVPVETLVHDQFSFYGINSPLERGRGVFWVSAIPDTPLPLSRGEYIKFNVVM